MNPGIQTSVADRAIVIGGIRSDDMRRWSKWIQKEALELKRQRTERAEFDTLVSQISDLIDSLHEVQIAEFRRLFNACATPDFVMAWKRLWEHPLSRSFPRTPPAPPSDPEADTLFSDLWERRALAEDLISKQPREKLESMNFDQFRAFEARIDLAALCLADACYQPQSWGSERRTLLAMEAETAIGAQVRLAGATLEAAMGLRTALDRQRANVVDAEGTRNANKLLGLDD